MSNNDPTPDGEKDTDIINFILNGSPFKIRSDDEKLGILKKGRPLYNLNILKREIGKNSNKTFHPSWYSIHKWLCGSKSYNKLFCWPCLLMRPETSSWCSIGNDNMKRFTSLAKKHARCKSHLKAIYEYDETLTGFGLPAEFANELKLKCKEEEGSLSDKTEEDNDSDNFYFHNTETKDSSTDIKHCNKVKSNESNNDRHQINQTCTPKTNNKITFKAWQAIYNDNFPVSKARFFEDYHLYKWKKKIAKQELKNARLLGEKLKFEIEILKAKIEYYNSLKQDTRTSDEAFVSATNPSVKESLQQFPFSAAGP